MSFLEDIGIIPSTKSKWQLILKHRTPSALPTYFLFYPKKTKNAIFRILQLESGQTGSWIQ
ncbi:hypothetical protein PSTEL_19610 [Paenibacillus stellifer]|uniref:Uncharacterized protein n=1 Tax=Paenibacillus stellifer TaxID=169760 RepID=A0A089LXY6_9BACL|nr:hypothetical protein PSTEL_19610 [Paenibacillus stellifer]